MGHFHPFSIAMFVIIKGYFFGEKVASCQAEVSASPEACKTSQGESFGGPLMRACDTLWELNIAIGNGHL